MVTILGSGFAAGTTVLFGATPASAVTIVSSQEVRATVPTQSLQGSNSITLTIPGGLPCTLPGAVVGTLRQSWGSLKSLYR